MLAQRAADMGLDGYDVARFETAAIPVVRSLAQLGVLTLAGATRNH